MEQQLSTCTAGITNFVTLPTLFHCSNLTWKYCHLDALQVTCSKLYYYGVSSIS